MGQFAINCTDDVKLKQFVKITPPDISLSFYTLQKKILENRASVTQKKLESEIDKQHQHLIDNHSIQVKDVKSLTANNPDHHKI